MKQKSSVDFYQKFHTKKKHFPRIGQIEVTYRCTLNCIYCYCKGSIGKELSTQDWKNIIQTLYQEGCMHLVFSGGDPLVRKDFLELYDFAKKKGFLITIFTNGQRFNKEILDYLQKIPPYSIELTINAITKKTYENITQVKGSFEKAMWVIKEIAKRKLPLVLKSNALKQNKEEIKSIKNHIYNLTNNIKGKILFRYYDPLISPRINGDTAPINYRLSAQDLTELSSNGLDMWQEYEKGLGHYRSRYVSRSESLYCCDTWRHQFFINPYGILKFCLFTDKFSSDLSKTSFREGFYKKFPKILDERFKTDSKCRTCCIRKYCYICPARARLEAKDEEACIEYYCELASAFACLNKISYTPPKQ